MEWPALAATALEDAAQGLSMDPFGNLILADSANNRVRKLSVNGMFSSHRSESAECGAEPGADPYGGDDDLERRDCGGVWRVYDERDDGMHGRYAGRGGSALRDAGDVCAACCRAIAPRRW